jgi:cell division protein FtsB
MKKDLKTKFLSSRVFIIIGICLLVFIGFSLGKETYRNYQIEKEIQALEEEISGLEKNNDNLTRLIEYFKTESYQEKEARQKLGLQKEGEKVVVITEENIESEELEMESAENSIEEFNQSEEIQEEEISNPRKWWNFIFTWKEN